MIIWKLKSNKTSIFFVMSERIGITSASALSVYISRHMIKGYFHYENYSKI